jgi:Rrf2 family protein
MAYAVLEQISNGILEFERRIFLVGKIIAISEAVSLGFHGMGLLAASQKRISARAMAETLGVSEAHLTKVFQRLVREGLVNSVRGPGGGFEMREHPKNVTLFSVYNAIEGTSRRDENFCSCCDKCPFASCIFNQALKNSARDFLNYLSAVTLDVFALKMQKNETTSNL